MAVPILVDVIKQMSPASPEGKRAYQSLRELGFAETEYKEGRFDTGALRLLRATRDSDQINLQFDDAIAETLPNANRFEVIAGSKG